MAATTRIALRRDDVMYDELVADESGLVTLYGWTMRPTGEIAAPILMVDGKAHTPRNAWRVHRPDVPSIPLAGFGFDWLLEGYPPAPPPLRKSFWPHRRFFSAKQENPRLSITIGDSNVACHPPRRYHRPDGDIFLHVDRVLKRQDVYGSGPPYLDVPTEVQRLLPLIAGPRILDFGCGAGPLVKVLRARGDDAIGIEIDRPEIVDNILPEIREHITIYQGDFPLPYEDSAFDCATAFEVIEHVDDYETAVRELRRVARRLLVSVPDMITIPLLSKHEVVPWHLLESTHLNFFTESSLEALLRRHFSSVELGRMSPRTIDGTRYHLSLLAICNV